MPRNLSPDAPDVLAANSAFYDAFTSRDVAAMDQLWARGVPVACIHPGWDVLRGRERVMESWRAILRSGGPEVRCAAPIAHLLGETAIVICREVLAAGRLIATNVFVREDGAWKLVHHQAGPVARDEDEAQDDDDGPSGLLN